MSVPFSRAADSSEPDSRRANRQPVPSEQAVDHERPISQPIRRYCPKALPQMRVLSVRPHLDNGSHSGSGVSSPLKRNRPVIRAQGSELDGQ